MQRRILNTDELLQGNVPGRRAMLEILEAGLRAADPSQNTRRLVRRDGSRLIIGCPAFEPKDCPRMGDEVLDLENIRRVIVIGAGKGIQHIACAIEQILGDYLSGGHVIDKKGHPIILERIGVTLGGHPLPDDDCVRGAQRILELSDGLTQDDLVFMCSANGISSLLTLPVVGITIADLRRTTAATQIERGMTTRELSPIRNHLDQLKGGRISRYFAPAKTVHILAVDPSEYSRLMHQNYWLHTLPDCTTFADALVNLERYDALDAIPKSVRRHLEAGSPDQETVKAEEFEKLDTRIFGIMPGYRSSGKLLPAMQKAEELGFRAVMVTDELQEIEASQAALYMAAIALTAERSGRPIAPPCALFSSGELLVKVGETRGVGGRNQEFALAAALRIAGRARIVMASVDTDGTDGPGRQLTDESQDGECLAGGIIDGFTVEKARRRGIDIAAALKKHATTAALRGLSDGIVVSPNISLNDLTVALIGTDEPALKMG